MDRSKYKIMEICTEWGDYNIGFNGVKSIERFDENGQMAYVPAYRVHMEDGIFVEAVNVSLVKYAPIDYDPNSF